MSYFTSHAHLASDRYGIFTETVRTGYMTTALTDAILNPGARRRLVDEHIFAGASYIKTEAMILNRAIREVAIQAIKNAVKDTGADIDIELELEALSAHLKEIESYILGQVDAQRLRDVLKLDRMSGDLLLRIYRNARGRHSVKNALARFRANISTQKFYFMNRSGASINPKIYIHNTWRQNLHWLYNDVYMNILMGQGIDRVQVVHPLGKSGMLHNKILHISPEMEPSYDDFKDAIFHPSSNFTIKPLK